MHETGAPWFPRKAKPGLSLPCAAAGSGEGGPGVKIEAGCGFGWLVALCLIFIALLSFLIPVSVGIAWG